MYAVAKLVCSPNDDGFGANFKSVAQINQLLIYGSSRQLEIEYKLEMRLILLLTVQSIGYLVNFPFYKLQGLRERKMDKFIANEKYNHQNTLQTNQ